MIRLTQRLMDMIESGREGKNMGLSTGIKKLDDLIYGVQRKWIYIIAADSGGGKTTFSLYSFVYHVILTKLLFIKTNSKILWQITYSQEL